MITKYSDFLLENTQDEYDAILQMLQTGDETNVELAISLLKNSSAKKQINKRFGTLLKICKCTLGELFLKKDLRIDNVPNLQECIFDLVNLEKLYLFNVGFSTIPTQIENLQKLNTLVLEGNFIKNADAVASLKNLTTLNLAKNQISKLPDNFGDLVNLDDLTLNENRLTTLPKSFTKLTKLRNLKIAKNNLREISVVDSLQALDIQYNEITELPYFPSLKVLEGSNNKLTKLPAFSPDVLVINLQHNQITEIDDSISNYQKLMTLNLMYNKIEKITPNIKNLKMLTHIQLFDNPIVSNLQDFDFGHIKLIA